MHKEEVTGVYSWVEWTLIWWIYKEENNKEDEDKSRAKEMRKQMGAAVPIFSGKGSTQKTLDLFLFRCNRYFERCSFDVMHKLFFIETKLGEAGLAWFKRESFDGYSEFVGKIIQRFVNPYTEPVSISRLKDLRYRNNPGKYIAEFKELIEAIGERKLSDNVILFLPLLPENMRRDHYINEQKISSMENLYNAFVCDQTFEGAESVYKTPVTKDPRIYHGCGIKGHIKQFRSKYRNMDNSWP
jgi:hypothetical protein